MVSFAAVLLCSVLALGRADRQQFFQAADQDVGEAVALVESAGLYVCSPPGEDLMGSRNAKVESCYNMMLRMQQQQKPSRSLTVASAEEHLVGDTEEQEESSSAWWGNFAAAMFCVSVAAMAAGLTLGMLGIDPLMLLIKERAGESEEERRMARKLLPVVKQHHRLLVTLLLMNACANEALPIFLEALVPPAFAVLVSVTLVLFFGEIIPSAIFTGPNQMKIASSLVPLVKTAMLLLYPIAGPIAGLLDFLLHGEEEVAAYNRGELSALIRIHYEERLSNKLKRLKQRDGVVAMNNTASQKDRVGGLDFSRVVDLARDAERRKSLRAAKSQVEHVQQQASVRSTESTGTAVMPFERREYERSNSIHSDEVMMVEGALQMKTKAAIDVYTPMRKVFCVPETMEMTERNLVNIYASGFTRVPVYRDENKLAIAGILMTRQLMVVNQNDKRPVSTLPLRTPLCVSPSIPLVHLLNILQTGGDSLKGGHLALVCARPHVANKALALRQEVPETAGLMGIITLEDVLEALLQEQIYDEMDRREREATRLAAIVAAKWRKYVRRRKAERALATGDVEAGETTPLVSK